MSDSYPLNADVLQSRWPAVFAQLSNEDYEALQVELVEGLESTLRVGGVQLTSRHGRMAEARVQAASLPSGSARVHVYGTGLGDLPRVLLENPALQRLQVHILNGALFALILRLTDQTDWLSDARVELSYAAEQREVQWPFFALPAELHLADEHNSRLRDRLVTEVHMAFADREFDPQSAHITQRLQDNLQLVSSELDVARLFGSQPGREVYLIATGPSLTTHYPQLKRIRAQAQRPLFICVDTAYRPLTDNGIQPDIVVSIDQRISDVHLPAVHSAGVQLVYMPLIDKQVLLAWQGTRYCAYSASPIYATLASQVARGVLFVGGSVIHPAVDLAVKMGASRITLFGADFAYPMNKTHAGWEDGHLGPSVEEARHWVLDGFGQRVRTQLNFRRYLGELERFIHAHPEVQFMNSSRAGAMIEGTTFNEEFVQ